MALGALKPDRCMGGYGDALAAVARARLWRAPTGGARFAGLRQAGSLAGPSDRGYL
jgi:hypothetical protein